MKQDNITSLFLFHTLHFFIALTRLGLLLSLSTLSSQQIILLLTNQLINDENYFERIGARNNFGLKIELLSTKIISVYHIMDLIVIIGGPARDRLQSHRFSKIDLAKANG